VEGEASKGEELAEAIDEAIARAIIAFQHGPGGTLRRAIVAVATYLSNVLGKLARRTGTPAALREAIPVVMPESIAAARALSLHRYVECVEKETKERDRKLAVEMGGLKIFDRIVFMTLLVAGMIALFFTVIGIGLAFAGLLAIAVVSGGTAIIPGAGTRTLFKLQRQLQCKHEELEGERLRNASSLATLRAIIEIEDLDVRKETFLDYVDGRHQEWMGSLGGEFEPVFPETI
jgi:hypothetical protein